MADLLVFARDAGRSGEAVYRTSIATLLVLDCYRSGCLGKI